MKLFKGLLFFVLIVCLGSCFNPPEFPIVPEIEFSKIEFVDSDVDSLILTLKFRDGDGDLGLDNTTETYLSDPFNITYFFQETGQTDPQTGRMILDSIPTNTRTASSGQQYDIMDIRNAKQGKLVVPRTRKKAGYSWLPAYNCADYEYIVDRKLLIKAEDAAVLDRKQMKIDSIMDPATHRAAYYQIRDTFLIAVNPNHYNIEVDFFVKEGNDFVEYDWRKEFCTQSFDGRFPTLSSKNGSALDGTLKYTMNSLGFVAIFSVKTLKLRIRIRDRALHTSRWIETGEFTLDKIRVR
jgi:hypothetical protein